MNTVLKITNFCTNPNLITYDLLPTTVQNLLKIAAYYSINNNKGNISLAYEILVIASYKVLFRDYEMGEKVINFQSNAKEPYFLLSNFAFIEGGMEYNGLLYQSSEHAYQSLKYIPSQRIRFSITGDLGTWDGINLVFPPKDADSKFKFWSQKNNIGIIAKMATNPKVGEKLGLIRNKDFKTSFELWKPILQQKYSIKPFKDLLKSTENAYLLEFDRGAQKGSIWGGLIKEDKLYGDNLMGKYLMQIREYKGPELVQIAPSIFEGKNKLGDFNWEIEKDIEPNTLYIFNDDNEHHFRIVAGNEKGNAIIRKYNKYNTLSPRSAGISTGWSRKSGGFTILSPEVRKIIDRDILEIKELLLTGKYNKIKFSSNSQGELGISIFKVNPAVKNYIVEQLLLLGEKID